MGQIKDAIIASQNVRNYSLNEIIGANRNIVKKMKGLEEKIYSETGLIVRDGIIRMNGESEEELVEGYSTIIPDSTRVVTHCDKYKLDEAGNIIVISKKRPYENLVVDEEDRIKIEKYKYILTQYYKLYKKIKEKSVYSIQGTNLKVCIDGESTLLYKESDDIDEKFTNFYIYSLNGESIRIDYYGLTIASDCEEIYDMDMDEVLSGIKIEGELPQIIKDNAVLISVMKTKNPSYDSRLKNGSYFKVADYSLINQKKGKLINQIKDMLKKSKEQNLEDSKKR